MFTEPSTALHFYVRPTVDFLNKFKLMRFATIQIVFYTETRQSFMTVALCTFGFVFFSLLSLSLNSFHPHKTTISFCICKHGLR